VSPIDALPEHLKGDVDRVWAGTDNRGWLMRQKKKLQYLLAAGPRAKGFWKWREMPKALIALRGHGEWRIENTDGRAVGGSKRKTIFNSQWFIEMIGPLGQPVYLSRIQPWCRWGIVLQWPLFFNCWFIYRKRDVVSPPRYKSSFGITKMFTFGIGFKRDADKVYWATCNMGGNFE